MKLFLNLSGAPMHTHLNKYMWRNEIHTASMRFNKNTFKKSNKINKTESNMLNFYIFSSKTKLGPNMKENPF